jgi:pimeloyl-ACP methyl ester carboxylesterase
MATFVLVHGAWHGGWCWKRVRKALQARGHDVFTPTLTGLADRSHLLTPNVNLDTHILDVLNLVQWEELSDFVPCGHSYGGCVISGVADRVPERIRALVYLDAFVLENGENLAQHVQGELPVGDGVPPLSAEFFKVNAGDVEWVNRQLTTHPAEAFQQRITLSGGIKNVKNVTFIRATELVGSSPFDRFYEQAKAKGWRTVAISCGHDVMLDRPEELTQVLVDAAQAQPIAL